MPEAGNGFSRRKWRLEEVERKEIDIKSYWNIRKLDWRKWNVDRNAHEGAEKNIENSNKMELQKYYSMADMKGYRRIFINFLYYEILLDNLMNEF